MIRSAAAHRKVLIGFSAFALASASAPAHAGLTFNLIFDSSLSAFGADLPALKTATQFVADEYSGLYTNNVTVNIDVKADPNPNGLGASQFEDTDTSVFSYAAVRAALVASASTAASISATNALPLTAPGAGVGNPKTGGYDIPNAEAKALGLVAGNNAALDGTFFIGVNNTYTFDHNNRAVPGAFDYLGTAEHEFSEIMGRTTQLGNSGFNFNLPMDLFRCSGGALNMDPAATNVSFSTDGCATAGKAYNAAGDGGDIQDWATSVPPDSFDAFGNSNESEPMTLIDETVMNTVGWQAASAISTPEPASLAILFSGVLSLIGICRRARTTTRV